MIMIMMIATQLERLLIFLHRHRPTTTRHLGTFGAQQAPAVRGLRSPSSHERRAGGGTGSAPQE